jgi:hypothetical protein
VAHPALGFFERRLDELAR